MHPHGWGQLVKWIEDGAFGYSISRFTVRQQ
jgi:hypothetical protein